MLIIVCQYYSKKRFNFLEILSWDLLEKDLNKFDIIINATSLGLKGGDDFKFNFNDVLNSLIEKLIYRHPHIYGDIKVSSIYEVKKKLGKIKGKR